MQLINLDLTAAETILEITEDSEVIGLFVGKDAEQVKTKLRIFHQLPGITSRVNLKIVLYDQSRFELDALLLIEKGAAYTDTYLKADALVLSDQAFAKIVPSLEIKENEVKGGHGATVGQLDPQQLFYLQSHGFAAADAEQVLVEAFIEEIQAKLRND